MALPFLLNKLKVTLNSKYTFGISMPRRMTSSYWNWKMIVLMGLVLMIGVEGGAMVSGIVFCDQCKDGHVSLFDYPLYGVKVAMLCPGSDSQMEMVREEMTNMFGGYSMRFDGTPDLSSCYTQVLPNATEDGGGSSSCQASGGPAQSLKLIFSFFSMEIYTVDALISQPAEPMSFCQSPPPPTPVAGPTPPSSTPFFYSSACSHQYWVMPQYRCYWKVVNPDTKVGLVFGPLAGEKYGADTTLWTGLQGRADPYKTLLREAITALLNSYNTIHFPYTSLGVVQRFNLALMGSPQTALLTAFRFKRANSGYTNANTNSSCKFNSCK